VFNSSEKDRLKLQQRRFKRDHVEPWKCFDSHSAPPRLTSLLARVPILITEPLRHEHMDTNSIHTLVILIPRGARLIAQLQDRVFHNTWRPRPDPERSW